MPELLYLPPWTNGFGYAVTPAVTRSDLPGAKQQGPASHRHTIIASVQRKLRLAELPYFEAFIHNEAQRGALKFIDFFIDQNGLQKGPVRIVNGAYDVKSDDLRHFIVSCQLEIFR